MSLDKKKLGEEELKRALLMMKYDSRKTLSENIKSNNLITEQNACPNSLDYQTIKTKAERVGDLVEYLNEPFTRLFYIEERAKELYDTIKELSTKNFYVTQTNTCENSLKRFTMDFESYYSETLGFNESLEEELQDLINGHIGEISGGEAKTNLQVALQLINDNKDKVVGGTDQVDPQEDQVSQNARNCGWLKTDGSADVEGYKNSNWKCPKSGKSGGDPVKNKYRVCKGTKEDPFKKGCYEANTQGPLHQVQTCIGVVSDGKFWTITESELINKTGQSTFTTDDVGKICKVQTSPETPPKTNPFRGWTSVEPEGGETTNNQRQAEG